MRLLANRLINLAGGFIGHDNLVGLNIEFVDNAGLGGIRDREDQGRTLVYASDAGYPDEGPPPDTIDFYRGADLLIHDATFTPEHRAQRRNRGLSSYADAAQVAARAQVKHLAMFHYDQDYADDAVDDMLRACRGELDTAGAATCKVTAAAEGLTLDV